MKSFYVSDVRNMDFWEGIIRLFTEFLYKKIYLVIFPVFKSEYRRLMVGKPELIQ